jgi:hypothetical protein
MYSPKVTKNQFSKEYPPTLQNWQHENIFGIRQAWATNLSDGR